MTSLVIEQFGPPASTREARVLEFSRRRAANELAGRTVWCISAVRAGRSRARALRSCLSTAGDGSVGSGWLDVQAREPLRDRDAACLNTDECDLAQVGVRLDDLVGNARQRPRDRVGIEEDLPRSLHRAHSAAEIGDVGTCVNIRLLSGLAGPG